MTRWHPTRVAGLAALLTVANCTARSPLAGGGTTHEETAIMALRLAFDAHDCDQVMALAEGFTASSDLRLHAVEALYGRCLYRLGENAGADLVLSRVADLEPADSSTRAALYYRGRARMKLAQHRSAATDFEHFIERFPHDFRADDARYQLGREHASLGELDQALADFAAVLAMPRASALRRAGATYRSGLTLFAEAREELTSPTLDAAFGWLELVLSDYPDSIYLDDALYREGRVRLAQERWGEARAIFAAFATRFPASPYRQAARYYEGRTLDMSGDLEGAVLLYTEAENLDPGGVLADDARYRRGHALYALAQRAAASDAPDAGARYVQAEEVLSLALHDLPDTRWRTSIAYDLGRVRYWLERFGPAIEAFAIDVAAPTSVFADNATYYTGRSWYRLAFRNDPESYLTAIVWFCRLLADFPASSYADDAAYFRARAYYELGDLVQAELAFVDVSTAFLTSPYRDNALRYLVLVRLRLGDCLGAARALAELALVTPPSPYQAPTQALFTASCGGGGGP